MTFTHPVTLFVGENGSGKSTLLEVLAFCAGSIAVGSAELGNDPTLSQLQPLAEKMKLIWNKRVHRGFFLRAEDFFGFIKRNRSLRQSLTEEISGIEQEFRDRSGYARSLARMPIESSLRALESRYRGDLDERSHGESFLDLFQSRFVPEGLYLLDEPEAALSPVSQLGLISLIKEMIAKDGQFIIATHSPILMAIPGAQILNFDVTPPEPVAYDAIEHVKLYRAFLEAPPAFFDKL